MLRSIAVTRLEDVGALVDDNLFERDILIATKRLGSSSNITERTQGSKPASQSLQGNLILEYGFRPLYFRRMHSTVFFCVQVGDVLFVCLI